MTSSITNPAFLGNRVLCRALFLFIAAVILFLPACESRGHFNILGYSSQPNYDAGIRTVYVPIFKNQTVGDTIRRGIEFDLTRAVVREIETKTPYKVVSDRCVADTELTGTITTINKSLLNINQNNEIREGQMTLTVMVCWKDLRTGKILSMPSRGQGPPPAAPLVVPQPLVSPELTPGVTPPELELPAGLMQPVNGPPGSLVQAVDNFIPEVGGSETTALLGDVNKIATQIVSMMESPW